MILSRSCSRRVLELGKGAVVGTLCLVIAVPQAFAAGGTPISGVSSSAPRGVLTQDEKTLHALNRLTFGPRPGDEQRVRRMGLEAWFQGQLHPERIDDAAFDARLAEFPALQLSVADLMRRYPSPGVLRQIEKQGTALPADPVEHAIYADSLAFYQAQVKQQAAGVPVVADATPAMNGADATMAAAKDSPADDAVAKGKAKRMGRMSEPAMSREDVEAIVALPPQERMARLVAMSPEEMISLRRGVKSFEVPALMQGLTPQQRQDAAAMQGGVKLIAEQALDERVLRDVYSQRQLQAVMDDFWLNHFSVYQRKNQNEPYLLASYERDAILPNSMGKFEDLLVATAKSPAMLMYLDNWESIGPDSLAAQRGKRLTQVAPNSKIAQLVPKGINENYARELMELHTLGVGGGYTQKDVIEVAKCFTGWTIERPYGEGGGRGRFQAMDNAQPGEFVFEENRHEPGTKTVLGHTIAEDGENEGLQVLHILATSPATAHFVSNKLAERFVSDTPSAALVNRMAATFLSGGGDIKAVLTTMFHSPEFWSPAVYRVKVKTPIEFVASALRASDASVGNPLPLVQAMQQLGMPVYGMQTPNGYSWKADQWVSSNALVSRMNFALVLSGDRLPGVKTDWPQLLGESADAAVAVTPTSKTELQLESLLLGESAGVHTRQTVLANYNDPTAQKVAAENFAKTAQAEPANAGDDMAGQAKLLRVQGGRRGAYGQGFQVDTAGTPLDTMAGLLLGSPDFQKR
jgi:uncharacterized protein (DUF1800 family)